MKTDMRVMLTKRLLREGLLRMLERESLSKISISELCKESGINRATFYKHYDSPAGILEEIARGYGGEMIESYEGALRAGADKEAALETCLESIYVRRDELRVLFSPNAEHSLNRFGLAVVNENLARKRAVLEANMPGDSEDHFLYAILTASAMFGLIAAWFTMGIEKTPREMSLILKNALRENLLF